MNALRIRTEILKAAYKRDNKMGKKKFEWHHATTKDGNVMLTTGNICFIIPFAELYLDLSITFPQDVIIGLDRMLKEIPTHEMTYTKDKTIIADNVIADVFICGDGKPCLVDEKYIKYFDTDAKFLCDKQNSLVYVEEYGNIVGTIAPIKTQGV